MKRLLVSLVPWMAMTTAAYGQIRSADVDYTYFDDAPTQGLRVGDECFVALNDVSHWGWHVDLKGDSASVAAEGSEFDIPVRTIGGKVSIPIRAAMAKLGITADWLVNTDTLQVFSVLTSVSVDSGHIKVASPLQIKPKPFVLTDPSRAVIDLLGARIGPKTSQTLEGGVRLTQYKPNVVRIVLQTSGVADITKIPTDPTKSCDILLSIVPSPDAKATLLIDHSADKKVQTTIPVNQTADKGGQTTVPVKTDVGSKIETGIVDGSATEASPSYLSITLDREDERTADLSIKFNGVLKSPATFVKPAPDVLEITLPGLNLSLPDNFKLDTGSVALTNCKTTPKGSVVTLDLVRPLGAEVSTNGQVVSIRLYKPNVGDGKLVGKVVVVDPGHGGWDNGASSAGLKEKDFALAIGKLVSDRLLEEGATVIMTRQSDVFIPLLTRSAIANNNHADFFISCHINDTGRTSNMSGSITFHHIGNEISRVLAECIQQQIALVSGIPNIGVWSDGKIYPQSGFSVLRNNKMVSVLVEFGFINNEHDRKRMSTKDFQEGVAKAVVKGLRVYLGDAKKNE